MNIMTSRQKIYILYIFYISYISVRKVITLKTRYSRTFSNRMFLCRKWSLFCSGNSNKDGNATHLEYSSYALTLYTLQYENIIILGDLNVAIGNSHREVFCNNLNFKSLIGEPTFYENHNDSFLCRLFFFFFWQIDPVVFRIVLCLKLFRFLEITVMKMTVMKMVFQKLQPWSKNYSCYEKFYNNIVREDLLIRSKNANTKVIYMSFLDFFEMFQQNPSDLVTFNESILNRKLHFLYSASPCWNINIIEQVYNRKSISSRFLAGW